MQVPFVDLKAQYLSIKSEIDTAISEVFEKGTFVGGLQVKGFEASFTNFYRGLSCISVGNGTDALFATLKMLGIGQGDEVITPALSWISTAEVISLTGATPIFVDVSSSTLTIDPEEIQKRISSKTKAVIVVHLYGQAAQIGLIDEICRKEGIDLIEDCAHAHLTEENGRRVGTFGTAGCFSFYPTKNLGAYGDGGCVVTKNHELAERIRRFVNHGGLTKTEHLIEGMNSRMDSLQAAVLTIKLNYLEEWTIKRIKNAELYRSRLIDVDDLELGEPRENTRHTFHLFVIRARRRDELQQYLRENGIGTDIHYQEALPFEPAYSFMRHQRGDFPNAEKAVAEILSLPIYPELTNDQILYVCEKIKGFYNLDS